MKSKIVQRAEKFANECLEILRHLYMAIPTAETYAIFYEYALKVFSVKGILKKTIFEVRDMTVTYSKNNRLGALGLDINQTLLNFKKGELSEGLTMQILQMDRLDLRDWMEIQFGENWRDDE